MKKSHTQLYRIKLVHKYMVHDTMQALVSLLLRVLRAGRSRRTHLMQNHPPYLPHSPPTNPYSHHRNNQPPTSRRDQRPRKDIPQKRIENDIHHNGRDSLHQRLLQREVIRNSVYTQEQNRRVPITLVFTVRGVSLRRLALRFGERG